MNKAFYQDIDNLRNLIAENLDADEVFEAANAQMFDLENPGFCVACGGMDDSCDPDTRCKKCDDCGEPAVFGAAELILYAV